MMCNVIMTLYDAAVERRAGSSSCKLLFTCFCKNEDLEAEKNSAGWVYRASEKSGFELSTDRSKISTHKRTRNIKKQVQYDKNAASFLIPDVSPCI